jgi:hypothetical protein
MFSKNALVTNERKHQQQQEENYKKSLDTNGNKTFKLSGNKRHSFNLPNQFTKVNTTMKGEEEVQDDTNHGYSFLMNSLRRP